MLERLITYFARHHLLTNLVFVLVLIGGVAAWHNTSKEELPDVTFDTVRISAGYPGAPADDVEYFVTRPIEEEVRVIEGVRRMTSTSSVGQSNITIELDSELPNIEEVVAEIRSAVLAVDLPSDVIDDPSVRVFKTSRKAIIDIALIHTDAHLLDLETRRHLQQYAFALENQLRNLDAVDSINKRGYLREEIQIRVNPDQLAQYEIPLNTVMQEIRANHVRQPAGTLATLQEPKVTLLSELDSPAALREVIVQGGFEGQVIRLGDVADIVAAYEKNTTIDKVNGHEAIMFNVVKSSSTGILDALEAVRACVTRFHTNTLHGTPIQLVFLDDESIDVRNRLSLIAINGGIGFLLIVVMLFLFLNARAAIWVAMGIPFTFCSTIIVASWMGHTINGITLAAVIVVLGMVVDDAIVVAENITRRMQEGMEQMQAIVQGTTYVLLPIIASVATTCVAFVPLFFFTGRFSRLVEFLPPIIFLMLGSSLVESILILPGHMGLHAPRFRPMVPGAPVSGPSAGHWFARVETVYGWWLARVLPFKWVLLAGFTMLLVITGWLGMHKMQFVMFPHEETRDLVLTGSAAPQFTRYETARKVREIEDILLPRVGHDVVGLRTQIASSRRGGAVEENQFRMIIEIVPKEQRKQSADQIIADVQHALDQLTGFEKLTFRKSRWGQDSGSPLEVLVQHNHDITRQTIVQQVAEAMRAHPALINVELDEGLLVPEYRVRINREKIKRLAINPQDVASTFRAILEGTVLYEFSNGEEDVRVRLTMADRAKEDMESVLRIPVENRNDYLVPLGNIVRVEQIQAPNAIARRDLKRTTRVYADLETGTPMTPVHVAEHFERDIFPAMTAAYPAATLLFGGEVEDTRAARRDLQHAVVLALVLIYSILAVLFNSLVKPLIIMLAIPFGVVGIIVAFFLHGKLLFGFYAAVGALGLAGVVINDSIIMLVKLENEFDHTRPRSELTTQVAQIAKTRLRAVVLTTLTTVAGVLPTAYGLAGYDAMLAEMMLALAWGMMFGTVITLVLVPCVYHVGREIHYAWPRA